MRKVVLVMVMSAAGIYGAPRADAQLPIPIAVEARVGAAFPTGGDFAEHAETAVGFGVNVAVQVVPNIGIYGGYSRTSFDLDITGARAVDSGFAGGVTAALPAVAGLVPWLGGGLLIHDLDVTGAAVGPGDSNLGFELGGGFAVPIAPHARLTPGVGFRRYTAPFLHGESDAPITYVQVGIGLNVAL